MLTVRPGAVVLCEDGEDSRDGLGLSHGTLFDFACNRGSNGEFAGATWSPDGKWLLVNIQRPAAT